MLLKINGAVKSFSFTPVGGLRKGRTAEANPEFDAVLTALNNGGNAVPIAHFPETDENANKEAAKVRTNFGNYAARQSSVKRGTRIIPVSTMPLDQQTAVKKEYGVSGGLIVWAVSEPTRNKSKK